MEKPILAMDSRSNMLNLGNISDDPERAEAKATAIILNRGGRVPPNSYLSIDTNLGINTAIKYSYQMQNTPIRVVFTVVRQYFINDSLEINEEFYDETTTNNGESVHRVYRIPIDMSYGDQTITTILMFEVDYIRLRTASPLTSVLVWAGIFAIAGLVIVILAIVFSQLMFPHPIP